MAHAENETRATARRHVPIIGAVLAALAVALVATVAAAGAATPTPRWIVFSATPPGIPSNQLFRIQTSGKGLRQLTTGAIPSTAPAFSPDGKRIAFVGTKKTPTIAPGKSTTLTVTFAGKGLVAYLCTLPGHAPGGMKGSFAVGVAPVVAPKPAPTPKPASTPTPTPTPATPAGPETLKGDPVAGAALFKVNECAGCHTLAAAGATGSIGPSLDARKPSQGTVKATVSAGAVAGGISMPSFSMSDTDLNNIAAYVYQSTHPGS